MEIERRPIKDLLPADYNPRKNLKKGDPEYEKLKKSILEFDYIDPVIWNKRTGRVVGGHQRLKVLKELGKTEIDVSVVDLPEDKEKALNLALNKTGGDWDMPLLKDLLVELDTGAFDIEITGFDEKEIEKLINQYKDPSNLEDDGFDADEEAKKIKEPVTKRGDVWQLGKHRLMCGDSTAADEVRVLVNGQEADLIVTDPPYNVDYTGKTKDALKIKNDKMGNGEFADFLCSAFENMYQVSKAGASIYVFHADSEGLNFRLAFQKAGFYLAQCCVWAKQTMVMGRQDYHWQHEPVLYGWKNTGSHRWFSDRKQTTLWKFDRPFRSEFHPTMKPIPLIGYPIENSSKEGDIVLDLFGGSGSTLLACEQANRTCFTMELDPVYCDVIVKRWEEYTKQKAELVR